MKYILCLFVFFRIDNRTNSVLGIASSQGGSFIQWIIFDEEFICLSI